jgi:hypothetical protein
MVRRRELADQDAGGLAVLSAVLFAACAAAGDFEVPPAQPAAASLPAELVSGPHFTVREPVRADGLMHHYELQSRYGDYAAYGQDALKVRAHEIEALVEMSKNSAGLGGTSWIGMT